MEALREGVPLVTTPVGAQGLRGLDCIVSIEATPDAFAEEVSRLLLDDTLWRARCAAQIGYARQNFSEAAFHAAFLGAIGITRRADPIPTDVLAPLLAAAD